MTGKCGVNYSPLPMRRLYYQYIAWLYRRLAKPLFFRLDPERIHDIMQVTGAVLGRTPITRGLTRTALAYRHPVLERVIWGLKFPNPIGLSAGFDKDGVLVDIIPSVGFGFMEIGSVTASPCSGNQRPRVWRLPNSRSLLINYGLKNNGAQALHQRLSGRQFGIPLGISIAMTNCLANHNPQIAISDYVASYRLLAPIADYVTLNVSCPNVSGGQPFMQPEHLRELLRAIAAIRHTNPLVIKLSPDVTPLELDYILELADEFKVDGIIVGNLTKRRYDLLPREMQKVGGISGPPLFAPMLEHVRQVKSRSGDRFVIIACGGVTTADDARRALDAGASLIQLITAMIYEGPQVVGRINHGLARVRR